MDETIRSKNCKIGYSDCSLESDEETCETEEKNDESRVPIEWSLVDEKVSKVNYGDV